MKKNLVTIFTLLMGSVLSSEIQNPQIIYGQAEFSKNGSHTEIRTSDSCIINYDKFNLAAHESVKFIQPSDTSRVLNRITGPDPSYLDGKISANGILYFVNPLGVTFGPNSIVNTSGLFVITGDFLNQDFINKKNFFSNLKGYISQFGRIESGFVHLISKQIDQKGVVIAPDNQVSFICGDDVKIGELEGSFFVKVASNEIVEKPQNFIGAKDVLGLAISGKVEAKKIHVEGNKDAAVTISGELVAHDGDRGGDVLVLGNSIRLQDANVDASGSKQGGTVLIGGDYLGKDEYFHSTFTSVDRGSVINVSAKDSGNGGKVIVWSDDVTLYNGCILARGGTEGGNGGFAETSGKLGLGIETGHVDTLAPKGEIGGWLLDPLSITIANSATDQGAATRTTAADCGDTTTNLTINNATINNATSNLTLCSSTTITQNTGAAINITTPGVGLTFQAGGVITLRAAITTQGGAVQFTGAGTGITLAATTTITTNGGNIDFDAKTVDGNFNLTANAGIGTVNFGGDIGSSTKVGTLSITGSTVSIKNIGTGVATGASATTITATGNITFNGANYSTAGAQTYTTGASSTFAINAGATTTFQTAGNQNVSFVTGKIQLASGSNFAISTGSGGDIAIGQLDAFTAGVETVTFNALGAGIITLNGPIGSVTRTGAVSLTSVSGTMTAQPGATITAASLSRSSTGAATFNGAINTNTSSGISISGSTVALNASVGSVTATNGPISITNTSTLTAGVGVNFTTSSSSGTFTQSGGGAVSLGGNITTAGANISIAGATTLTNGITVSNNSGSTSSTAINFSSSITGAQTLVLDAGAGSVTVGGTIGTSGATALTSLTISGTNGVSLGGFGTASVTGISGTTNINTGGTITLTGSNYRAATMNFNSNVNITSASTSINSTNNPLNFSGTITGTSAGGQALAISSGLTTFTGAVGTSSVPLGALSVAGSWLNNAAVFATSVSQSGGSSVTLSADITTKTGGTGAISFATAITLTGSTRALNSSDANGNITISGTVNATSVGSQALVLNAGSGTITSSGVIGGSTRLGALTMTGSTITLSAANYNSNAQTFNGNVILNGNVATDSNSNPIQFNGTLDSFSTTARNLTVNAGASTVSITGDIGTTFRLGNLTVTANNGITLKNIGVSTPTPLQGAAVTALTTTTGDITFNGSYYYTIGNQTYTTGSGRQFTLASTGTTTFISTSNNVDITFNTGKILLNSSGNLAITAANTGIITIGPLDASSAGVGNVTFSTLTTGPIIFNGPVGATTRIGNLSLSTATGAITANAGASITASAITTSGGATTFNSTLNTNTSSGISITGTTVALNADVTTTANGPVAISNTSTLTIASGVNITLNGSGSFSQIGGGTVSLGGNITTATGGGGSVSFTNNTSLVGSGTTINTSVGNGDITFSGTIIGTSGGPQSLTLNAGLGNITLSGAVGGTSTAGRLDSFSIVSAGSVNAQAIFAATVTQTTATTASYGGFNTNSSGGVSLTGGGITLTGASTVTGNGSFTVSNSGALTISSGANITFTGTGVFTQSGGGSVSTAGNITTNTATAGTDHITFTNAITLAGPVVFTTTNGNVKILSTIEGTTASTENLTINMGTGSVTFPAAVGNTTPLGSLSVTGNWVNSSVVKAASITQSGSSTTATLSGDITATTGGISFAGAITLTGTTSTLTASAGPGTITLSGIVDGTTSGVQSLVLDAGTTGAGAVVSSGVIGGTIPLNLLTFKAGTSITLSAANYNSNAQTFTGNVLLGGNVTLDSNSNPIHFTATIDSVSSTNRNLIVNAGTSTVQIDGAIGTTFDLGSLTITADSGVTLNDIGISTPVPSQGAAATTITTTTGDITFNGSYYYTTGNQTYTTGSGQTFSMGVTGGTTTFTSTTNNINVSFVTGRIQLADGGDLAITTGSGGDIEIGQLDAFAAGVEAVTLTTGAAGFMNLNGPIGGTTRIGALTLSTGTGAVTANTGATIAAASITRSTSSTGGATTFNEAVNTNTSTGISITGTTVTLNAGVTATGNGSITIDNSSTLTIASGAAITLNGTGSFQSGSGAVSLGANITTAGTGGGNITIGGATTLVSDVTIDNSTGSVGGGTPTSINFSSTITGTQALVLNAGSGAVNVSGRIGTSTATGLTSLAITGDAGITLGDIGASNARGVNGSTTLNSTGNITLNGAFYRANAFDFNGDVVVDASFTMDSNTNPINFNQKLDWGTSSVVASINAGSAGTTFTGAVGSGATLGVLSVAGNWINSSTVRAESITQTGGSTIATIYEDITSTTGGISFVADVILKGTTRTFDSSAGGGTINFSNTVSSDTDGAQALVLDAGAGSITFGNTIGPGTGKLATFEATAAAGITVNSGVFTLDGTIDFHSPVIIGVNSQISSNAGTGAAITFDSSIDGQRTLTVDAGTNAITLSGLIGSTIPTNALNFTATTINLGSATAGTTITTSNDAVTFNGDVVLKHDVRITSFTTSGGAIFFSSAISGDTTAKALTLESGTGIITLTTAVTTNIASFSTTSSGTLFTNAITASGDISLASPIHLNGTGTFTSTGGDVFFGSTIIGAETLEASATSGTVTFDGVIGSATATRPTALTVNADKIVQNAAVTIAGNIDYTATSIAANAITLGSDITTTGTGNGISFTGDTTLSGDATLNTNSGDGNITLGAVIQDSSNRVLTVNAGTAGSVTIASLGASSGSPLDSFVVTGSSSPITVNGAVYLNTANIDGTGAVTFSTTNNPFQTGALIVGRDVTFSLGTGDFTASNGINGSGNIVVTNSGTVAIGGGGSLTGSISFDTTDTVTVSSGDFTFTGGFTHNTGHTILSGGIATQNNAVDVTTLATSGAASIDCGTAAMSFNGLLTGSGTFTLTSGSASLPQGANTTASLLWTNAGLVTLSGATNFTFGGTTNITQLDVSTGNYTTTFSGGGTISYGSGGSGNPVVFNNTGNVQFSGSNITFTDGVTNTSNQTNLSTTLGTGSGNISLGVLNVTGTAGFSQGSGNYTVAGSLTGSGSLATSGTGAGTFSGGTSSFTGSATLNNTGGVTFSTSSVTFGGGLTVSGPTTTSVNIATTGTLLSLGAVTLANDIVLNSTDGNLVTGSVSGAHNLVINSGAGTSTLGSINVTTFNIAGATNPTINGTLTAANLTTDNGVISGTLTFNDFVSVSTQFSMGTGAYSIIFNGGAKIVPDAFFNNSLPVSFLGDADYDFDGGITFAGGGSANKLDLSGALTVNGDLTVHTIALEGNSTVTTNGFDFTLDTALNGLYDLLITTGAGTATVNGLVGTITPVKSLTISAANVNLGGTFILGGNTLTVTGPVTLVDNLTVQDTGNITFSSTITGNYSLSMTTTGGEIYVGGTIDTSSSTVSGQPVTLTAYNNLSLSSVITSGGGSSDAGAISLTSNSGDISTNNLQADGGSTAGNAANISVSASSGSILVNNITAIGGDGVATGGNGGNITLACDEAVEKGFRGYTPQGKIAIYGSSINASGGSGTTAGTGGTISIASSGRVDPPNMATIYGDPSGSNLTIEGRSLNIGNNEALTLFGDLALSLTESVTIGDVVTVGTTSITAPTLNLYNHDTTFILDSSGFLSPNYSIHFLGRGVAVNTSTVNYVGIGPALSIIDVTSLYTAERLSQLLMYKSDVLNFDNTARAVSSTVNFVIKPEMILAWQWEEIKKAPRNILAEIHKLISKVSFASGDWEYIQKIIERGNPLDSILGTIKEKTSWNIISALLNQTSPYAIDYVQATSRLLRIIDKFGSAPFKESLKNDIIIYTKPQGLTVLEWNDLLVTYKMVGSYSQEFLLTSNPRTSL